MIRSTMKQYILFLNRAEQQRNEALFDAEELSVAFKRYKEKTTEKITMVRKGVELDFNVVIKYVGILDPFYLLYYSFKLMKKTGRAAWITVIRTEQVYLGNALA